MNASRIAIIGAGQGGLQVAISLRQNGHEGEIYLIGAEAGLPYQRPPLSKAYLLEGNPDTVRLRPESFFATKNIDYMPETRVCRIDRDQQEIVTENGQQIGYDHLVLATGARNMQPPIEGIGKTCDLRTLKDADRLRARLDEPQRIAIIGGGFIGLEFAAVARKLAHEVTVIEAAPRVMARAVSSPVSDYFARRHREWGTDLRYGQAAAAIVDDGVILADGTLVPATFVLLAAGVCPNVELAQSAGLTVDNGIKVDGQLLTSDPAISALGDCAAFPDYGLGRHIRLESVQAATDHARLIAERLVKGKCPDYTALPWFWSDQGDSKLQIAGFADPQDRAVIISDTVTARVAGDRVSAVETINDARTHMKARRLLGGAAHATLADLENVMAA